MHLAKTLVICSLIGFSWISAEETPFSGSWAFGLPDGRPVWLKYENGEATLLWSTGSARPVKNVQISDDGVLSFERNVKWKPNGRADAQHLNDGRFSAKLDGEELVLTTTGFPKANPENRATVSLRGKKMPAMPPAPDLDKIRFGLGFQLIDEEMSFWKLEDPNKKNGWRVENGELINETPKTDFSAYGDYGNLLSTEKFGDFRLTIEYNVETKCNSGIYLRGAYEAQVVDRDSPMQGISGPGAIFGRIAPSENAGKPGGEWNRYVLTLVDRHITVELNGKVVIDNQPLEGCTGGGISADDTAKGPIFLQGDHTSVRYRNIVIEPRISAAR